MNIKRAIATGILAWLIIFTVFAIMNFIPGIRESMVIQGLIGGLCIIPAAIIGASIYYKKSNRGNGFLIGIVMVFVALLLDLLITVPFIEIPYNGRGHIQFLANPVLWILLIENVIVIHLYWLRKVKPSIEIK